MKKILLVAVLFAHALLVFAVKSPCSLKGSGYKVVKNTLFPFVAGKDAACFFAYYTTNPDPIVGVQGNGNPGDSVWYAYYIRKNPAKIYEFPKPNDTFWSIVCNVDAVSFIDIDDDGVRDVTVIGSCNKNRASCKIVNILTRIFHEGYGESSNNPIRFICLTKNQDDFRHDTVYQGKIRISSLPRQDSRSSIC